MMDDTQLISFPAQDTDRIQADLVMNMGAMKVSNGTQKVVESEIYTSLKDWQPDVSYDVHSGFGHFSVRQPLPSFFSPRSLLSALKHPVNRWKMKFNHEIPLDLGVHLNAGKANIDLHEMAVRGLGVQLNGGDLDLNLSGDYPLMKRGGLQINGGNANMIIDGGFAALDAFAIEINGGTATLDLSGDWYHKQWFAIQVNAGALRLRLPKHVGVEIIRESGLSFIRPFGVKDRRFHNNVFGKTAVDLFFHIVAPIGRVKVDWVDTQAARASA